MAVLLSLLAALTYGSADFVGGLVTKRNAVLRVVLLSQILGTLPLVLAFPLLNDGIFRAEDIAWGIGAGISGATGIILLYRGLSVGRMSVVAPITAVEAASVPVAFGLATGERPTPTALLGVAVALLAVALISRIPAGDGDPFGRAGIAEAFGAGLAFGAFFIFLAGAGDDTGLWPLISMRAASVSLVAVITFATGTSLRPTPGTFGGIALAGILDVSANLFYLLSTRYGLLSLVAVITSMYPAGTVLLARLVLHERMTRMQLLGLALAAVGVTLISLG